MQIRLLTEKAKEENYSFHQMAELEVIRTENTFVKVELLICQ
jgi:hypothetical protein